MFISYFLHFEEKNYFMMSNYFIGRISGQSDIRSARYPVSRISGQSDIRSAGYPDIRWMPNLQFSSGRGGTRAGGNTPHGNVVQAN